MQRYARFVREGNKNPLVGRGAAAPNGWVIKTGKDKGAIGCGYYAKHLSTLPYVIATGTTGGAFFAELANRTVDAADREGLFADAHAAMLWTAGVVLPSGEIPYILDGKSDTKTWPLDTIAYVTEGIVGLDAYYPAARADLAKNFESTVKYLVATQLANGSWGKLRSADQQRSARVLTLLSWWLRVQARAGRTDANVSAAVDKCASLCSVGCWHRRARPIIVVPASVGPRAIRSLLAWCLLWTNASRLLIDIRASFLAIGIERVVCTAGTSHSCGLTRKIQGVVTMESAGSAPRFCFTQPLS